MEPNEKADNYPPGLAGLLSWGGLAVIGITLFFCGANEWSLIPVFVGTWILWRGSNSNGLAIFVGIGLAILLTRFGLSLERNLGFGPGFENSSGLIIFEHEGSDTIPIVLAALCICVGYWVFYVGIQMQDNQRFATNRIVGKIPFFAMGKWVTWFWFFVVVAVIGFGVNEILLKYPDEILSSLGWRGSVRVARFLVMAWLLGAGVVLVQFLSGFSKVHKNAKAKSLGYLQEILWRETRREQSRSQQWIVRAVQTARKVR